MDANLHNCGKLPWTILHDCIQCEKITNANNKLIYKYSCDNFKNFYFFQINYPHYWVNLLKHLKM